MIINAIKFFANELQRRLDTNAFSECVCVRLPLTVCSAQVLPLNNKSFSNACCLLFSWPVTPSSTDISSFVLSSTQFEYTDTDARIHFRAKIKSILLIYCNSSLIAGMKWKMRSVWLRWKRINTLNCCFEPIGWPQPSPTSVCLRILMA